MPVLQYFRLAIFVAILALLPTFSIAQYTFKVDSGSFNYLPESDRLSNLKKSFKYGVFSENLGGFPPTFSRDTMQGYSFAVNNFHIFGHLVDSVHVPFNVPNVIFEMSDGRFSVLTFSLYAYDSFIPFNQGGVQLPYFYTGNDFEDDAYTDLWVDARVSFVSNGANRLIKIQYLGSTSYSSAYDKCDYEIQIDEGSSKVKIQYGTIQGSRWTGTYSDLLYGNKPKLTFLPYGYHASFVNGFKDPVLSFSGYEEYYYISPQDPQGRDSLKNQLEGKIYEFNPSGHCSNGVKDADEQGVDCGGSQCVPCSCYDGEKNISEFQEDCGGKYCMNCTGGDWALNAYDNPLCDPKLDSIQDTVQWAGGMDTIYLNFDENLLMEGLNPHAAYKITTDWISGGETVTIYHPGSGKLQDFSSLNQFGRFGLGNVDILNFNTDTNRSVILRFDDVYDCGNSFNSRVQTLILEELADSASGLVYEGEPEICLVTYDSASGNDVLVYEDLLPNVTDRVLVEFKRFPAKFGFEIVTKIDTGELFVDIPNDFYGVNTDLTLPRAYAYKLSNSSGARSLASTVHTMMVVNPQKTRDSTYIQVAWSAYTGFIGDNYYIYRQEENGPQELVDSVPWTRLFYTDSLFPCGKVKYFIAAKVPKTCTTKRAGTTRNYKTTRSKPVEILTRAVFRSCDTATTSIEAEISELNQIGLYPNPTTGAFEIRDPQNLVEEVLVVDQQGRVLVRRQDLIALNLEGFSQQPPGVYYVRLFLKGDQIETRKLVKF